MRNPEEQARGETREEAHATIARQQFDESNINTPRATVDGPGSTPIDSISLLKGDYLSSDSDDTTAEAPIAPVDNG